MTRRLPDEASTLANDLEREGLRHPTIPRLVAALAKRTAAVMRECERFSDLHD